MDARGRLHFVNIPLLAVVALLALYGAVIVGSAVSGMDAGPAMVRRHLLGLAIGTVFMLAAWAFDYRKLQRMIVPLFVLLVIAIVSPRIPGIGDTAKGATAWLEIGGVRLFQPSEPAKLVLIVLMAAVIARFAGSIEKPKDVAVIFGIMAVPVALIMVQPDLGTGMVFVAITLGMLLIGGLKPRWFAVFALLAVIVVGVVLQAGILQEYQTDRLMVFVDPTRDPDGAGYNLAQSKIAIGSGELTGKGLGLGTQGGLNFLPERHTDFVFAVLGEELGFLGAIGLLALYLVLLITSLEVAAQSQDLFGSLIAAGIISMWLFQTLQNVGMTIGLMPITGIPLPFVSYGSSFMVTNLAAVGMLLSIWARRKSGGVAL